MASFQNKLNWLSIWKSTSGHSFRTKLFCLKVNCQMLSYFILFQNPPNKFSNLITFASMSYDLMFYKMLIKLLLYIYLKAYVSLGKVIRISNFKFLHTNFSDSLNHIFWILAEMSYLKRLGKTSWNNISTKPRISLTSLGC